MIVSKAELINVKFRLPSGVLVEASRSENVPGVQYWYLTHPPTKLSEAELAMAKAVVDDMRLMVQMHGEAPGELLGKNVTKRRSEGVVKEATKRRSDGATKGKTPKKGTRTSTKRA